MAVTDVITALPELQGPINTLILILKVIGGIIGIYLIFWIINMIINARKVKYIKEILANVQEINQKLKK